MTSEPKVGIVVPASAQGGLTSAADFDRATQLVYLGMVWYLARCEDEARREGISAR